MREQEKKNVTVRADLMQRWGLQEQITPPPPIRREDPKHAGIPATVRPGIGVPRLKRKGRDHTGIQKRLYRTTHTIMRAMAGGHEIRVTKMWPHINWARV
jgi:hypothetical protein